MLYPLFKSSVVIPFLVLLVSFVLNSIFLATLNAEEIPNRKEEVVNVPPIESANPIQPKHFPFRFNAQVVSENVSMNFYFSSSAKLRVPFLEWYVKGRQLIDKNYYYVSFTGNDLNQPGEPEVEVFLALPLRRSTPLSQPLTLKERIHARTKLREQSSLTLRLLMPNFFTLYEQTTSQTHHQVSTIVSNCFDESMGSKVTTLSLHEAHSIVVDTNFHLFAVDSRTSKVLYNEIINNVLTQTHSCSSFANSLNFYNGLAKETSMPLSTIPLFHFLLQDFKSPSPLGLLTALSFFSMIDSKDVFPSLTPPLVYGQVTVPSSPSTTVGKLYNYLKLRSIASIKNSVLMDPKGPPVLRSESLLSFPKEFSFTLMKDMEAVHKQRELVSSLKRFLSSPHETLIFKEFDSYSCDAPPSLIQFFEKPDPSVSTSLLNEIQLKTDWVDLFSKTVQTQFFYSSHGLQSTSFIFSINHFQYLDTHAFFAVALPDSPMSNNEGSLNENENSYQVILIQVKRHQQIAFSMHFLEDVRRRLTFQPAKLLRLFIPTFRLHKHDVFHLSQIPYLSTLNSKVRPYFHSQFNLNNLQIHQRVTGCIDLQHQRRFTTFLSKKKTRTINSPFYYVIVDKLTGVPIFYDKIEDVMKDGEEC